MDVFEVIKKSSFHFGQLLKAAHHAVKALNLFEFFNLIYTKKETVTNYV
jgi:hypothetical protein